MRKIYLSAVLLFISAAAFAQNGVDVKPVVLEERDGKLYMELEVTPNHKEMRANDHYVITPELRSQANSKKFPDIIVNGSRRAKILRRAEVLAGARPEAGLTINKANRKKTGPERYRASVPYERWMDKSVLYLNGDRGRCACKSDLFSENTGLSPRFAMPPVYEVKPLIARVIPEKESVKRRNIESQAFLDFKQGRAEILPDFRSNPAELKKIRETLDAVHTNKDMEITSIRIEGFASPEGSATLNKNLSARRAQALKDYIMRNYKIPADMITSGGGGEDWTTLRRLVEESDIAGRSEVLAIIDNSSDPDTKERELKALSQGAVFKTLLADYFPQLRRVDYKVDFNVRAYEDGEIGEAFLNDPSMLSGYEMYLLAGNTNDRAKQVEIFETMERLYPDNPAVAINAMARYIEAKKFPEARKWIKAAGESSEALNNIGVVYMMEGDYDNALDYFNRAVAAGSKEARHNLKELEAKIWNVSILTVAGE